MCHNESSRNDIIDKIIETISGLEFVKRGTKANETHDALRGGIVEALIEFSHSIHAEMEAILAVGRDGKHFLVGSNLYTNTYPCHNCARHIVAAGIEKVVHIEPYLKSHAIKLHFDAITENPKQKNEKVFFQQFDGIAPRNDLKLFRPVADRKGVRVSSLNSIRQIPYQC